MHKFWSISTLVLAFFFLGESQQSLFASSLKQQPLPEWTIMVFMNGDNNLDEDAIENFKSMAKSGSSSQVKIVVELDRKDISTPPNDTSWSTTKRFLITKGITPRTSLQIKDLEELNMGSATTLSDFIKWTMANYPAKHYMLDIWSHGQGFRLITEKLHQLPIQKKESSWPKQGIKTNNGSFIETPPNEGYKSCSSDQHPMDTLYNKEIQDALRDALGGRKLDILGFDCCLMGMVETAYAMRNYADIMIASEELIPNSGWDYEHWLSDLIINPKTKPRDLSIKIVDCFKDMYESKSNYNQTLSAVNLSKIDNLKISIDQFSDYAIKNFLSLKDQLISARNNCTRFAPGEGYYHIDLNGYCQLVSQQTKNLILKELTEKITNRIYDARIISYAGKERIASPFYASGLAIFFPENEAQLNYNPISKYGYNKKNAYNPVEFVQKSKWPDFLKMMIESKKAP